MSLYYACTTHGLQQHLPFTVLKLRQGRHILFRYFRLQQHLPFTVCDAGCETAEEQSDDEVRTSQVPERSEGKTKVIRQQSLPFTVLKPSLITYCFIHLSCFVAKHLPFTVLKRQNNSLTPTPPIQVATAPTVYGIETLNNLRLRLS